MEATNTSKWLGLAMLVACAPFALLAASFFGISLTEDSEVGVVLVTGGYLIGTLSLMVGATGLIRGTKWARRTVLVGAGLSVGIGAFVAFKAALWIGCAAIPHALAIFALVTPAFDVSPSFDPVRAPRLRKRYLLVGVLFAALTLTLFLAKDEIHDVGWELREERWQSQCESTGEREPCGRWALVQIFSRDDPAANRDGLAIFDRLCADQKVHRACEYAAKLRSSNDQNWMFGREDAFLKRRARGLAAACKAKKPGACAAAAAARKDVRDKAVAEKACAKGDGAACHAMSWHEIERQKKLCETDEGEGCALRTTCFEGEFFACRTSESPMERALEPLVDEESDNPALYRVRVQPPENARTCAEDSALACFIEGLNATADVNPFVAEDPLPVRSLEVTMGRACELKHGPSCYVFALRLLDQRSPDEEHERRALELLDAGCEEGHQRSCWVRAMLDDPLETLDQYRTQAREACRWTDDWKTCNAYHHVVAYDVGATPILVADGGAFRRMRWGCWKAADDESCVAGASLMLAQGRSRFPTLPPLLVQGSELAQTACRAGNPRGCRQLFHYATFANRYGMKSSHELRAKICPQIPDACAE